MESPRSAEEMRKIELSLEELVLKFQNRVQLVRDDLKSLILEIEKLKIHIGDLRVISNDNTREISDLTNEHQSLTSEEENLKGEIDSLNKHIISINNELQELQASINEKKTQINNLDEEKTSLTSIMSKNSKEVDSLKTEYNELQPNYERKLNKIQDQFNQLTKNKEMLNYRFKAIRLLSKSYLQTPEVNLIRFLARKPNPTSTLVEIRSALGIDSQTLNKILGKLNEREILLFDKGSETITLKVIIDLFEQEA